MKLLDMFNSRFWSSLGVIFFTLCTGLLHSQIVFTEVAGAGGDESDIDKIKDGGCAFADFDLDGDLDLVVNTNDNGGGNRSFFLRNENGIFKDETSSIVPGLKDYKTERCVTWGDCNNDGYPDFMVNTHNRTTIYLNNAGVNFTRIANITGMTDGQNTEGSGWFDYDNDGDLDLFQENHNFGIDIFQNNGAATPVFTQVTINAVGAPGTGAGGIGLPEGGSSTADYAASTDLNLDGYTDLIARRENAGSSTGLDLNQHDIFLNQGGGTFAPQTLFSETTSNGNKGGVATADFDNDGDLDILWTSASLSGNLAVIYEHDGVNSGTFTQVVGPFRRDNNALDTRTDYDGCTVGDIDNDGDEDIFLTANSGTSRLFLNNSTGPGDFQFRQPGPVSVPGAAVNYGIDVTGDGEGCIFVDYDNDGDLDLYVNVSGAKNQLWENDYIGSLTEAAAPYQDSYIRVIPRIDLGGGVYRDATNSIVFLQDCDGNTISGIKEVGGGDGHGTQKTPWLHFGLPDGRDRPYLLVVQFPRQGTTLNTVSKVVIPSNLPPVLNSSSLSLEQTVIINNTDEDDTFFCKDEDGDGVIDLDDLDDDNDGIFDTDECSFIYTFVELSTTKIYSFAQTITGCEATHFGDEGTGGVDDPLLLLDDDITTELRMHEDDFLEFDLGQLIPAGAQITLREGAGGEDEPFDIYVSNGSTDPAGDTNSGSCGGVAYANATSGGATLIGSNIDSDADFTFTAPFSMTHIQFHCLGSHGGWAEMEYSTNPQTIFNTSIEFCDTDDDGIPDSEDLDSDGDGCFDVWEAGYTDAGGDGIIDGTGIAADGTVSGSDGYLGTDPMVTDPTLITVACDLDGDGIAPIADLDDDNDGIPDIDEVTATSTSFQPPCGTLVLDFSSVPTLVSGTALMKGAVYKYTGVATGLDALVTIADTSNAATPDIDANATDPTYFKPRTAFNLAAAGERAFMEYKFEFVTGVGETPVVIPELFINYNDIDGNANYSEENWAEFPVSYTIDDPSDLNITVDDWIIATGGVVEFAGAGNSNPEVNFSVRYLNVSELTIRVGAVASVVGASSGGRQHSVQFECVTNFLDPTTYYIDFDEDGVINSLDLDSDNDGIFDSVEAGHGELDVDNNGVIDGTPADFGTNGLFDGVETVDDNGILDYTVNDADLDGNIDAQELDSDDDGCNDVIEAGYSDPDGNGLLGTGN